MIVGRCSSHRQYRPADRFGQAWPRFVAAITGRSGCVVSERSTIPNPPLWPPGTRRTGLAWMVLQIPDHALRSTSGRATRRLPQAALRIPCGRLDFTRRAPFFDWFKRTKRSNGRSECPTTPSVLAAGRLARPEQPFGAKTTAASPARLAIPVCRRRAAGGSPAPAQGDVWWITTWAF
jgi:hypothetical protein